MPNGTIERQTPSERLANKQSMYSTLLPASSMSCVLLGIIDTTSCFVCIPLAEAAGNLMRHSDMFYKIMKQVPSSANRGAQLWVSCAGGTLHCSLLCFGSRPVEDGLAFLRLASSSNWFNSAATAMMPAESSQLLL